MACQSKRARKQIQGKTVIVENKRNTWQFPWGYREGLLIAMALFVTGYLIQISSNSYAPLLSFPLNIIVLGIYTGTLIFVKVFLGRSPVVQWLSSVPAAIGSVFLFGILSLFMGLVPQSQLLPAKEIIPNITNSWPYFLALFYLLTVLGLTVIKRVFPFKGKVVWFLFNHLGLWVVIAGASFGASDIIRLKMETRLKEPVWIAVDEYGNRVEPGIAVELQKFSIGYFAPSLSLCDFSEDKQIEKVKPVQIDSAGVCLNYDGWNIKVKEYMPSAVWHDGIFSSFYGPGSVPAVFIVAKKDPAVISGWVNPGNSINPSQNIMLDENTGVVLQFPLPKSYRSEIKIYSKTDSIYNVSVEVNKPAYIEGWRIYQMSYDDKMGKWSETSVLELNRDPWLPVVYTGLFMMIIGAVYLFAMGVKTKGEMK